MASNSGYTLNNEELRIVLVGKTGSGKSATGNTILGKKSFESKSSPKSLTIDCSKDKAVVDRQQVAVIKISGLFDIRFDDDKTTKVASQCVSLTAPGPHVFLVVIGLDRFTEEDKQTVQKIQQVFGEAADKYSMVLFTHGDNLDEDETAEEFFSESPDLQELVKRCNNMYHVFNNKTKDRSQVTELLQKIRDLVQKNGGSHYTNEMFQEAERAIEEEKQHILKEKEEQIRKETEEMERKAFEKYEMKVKEIIEQLQAEREKERKEREEERKRERKEMDEERRREMEDMKREMEDMKREMEEMKKIILKHHEEDLKEERQRRSSPGYTLNNEELRIVLVGKTGSGKSATGNTILGKKSFESKSSPKSQTLHCSKVKAVVDSQQVAVIDTPGLFDTRFDDDKTTKDVSQCVSFAAPGPHVFLVVIRLDRFTEEEKQTVQKIQQVFGEAADKYSMVLFTRADKLDEDMTIEEFLSESPNLQELVKRCNNKYHVFNNKTKDRSQVTELLQKIRDLVQKNGGSHYTNEMFQKAERAIEEEKQRILKEKEEQIRKEREEIERNARKKFEMKVKEINDQFQAEREKERKEREEEMNEERRKEEEEREQKERELEEMKDRLREQHEKDLREKTEKLQARSDREAREEAESKNPCILM